DGAGRRGRRPAERILPGRRDTTGETAGRAMKTWLVGIAALLAVLALPGVARADVVDVRCNGSPCSGGWYNTDVAITFTVNGATIVSGCQRTVVNADTADATASCTVNTGGNTDTSIVQHVKRDATPPSATGSTARAPDPNRWYNQTFGNRFSCPRTLARTTPSLATR